MNLADRQQINKLLLYKKLKDRANSLIDVKCKMCKKTFTYAYTSGDKRRFCSDCVAIKEDMLLSKSKEHRMILRIEGKTKWSKRIA